MQAGAWFNIIVIAVYTCVVFLICQFTDVIFNTWSNNICTKIVLHRSNMNRVISLFVLLLRVFLTNMCTIVHKNLFKIIKFCVIIVGDKILNQWLVQDMKFLKN